jgi:hypothetical protein
VLGETLAELCDRHVLRIGLIGVEARAVLEHDDQAGVVRPRGANDVFAHHQVDDTVEVSEIAKTSAMILAGGLRRVWFVLETNDVCEHGHWLERTGFARADNVTRLPANGVQ